MCPKTLIRRGEHLKFLYLGHHRDESWLHLSVLARKNFPDTTPADTMAKLLVLALFAVTCDAFAPVARPPMAGLSTAAVAAQPLRVLSEPSMMAAKKVVKKKVVKKVVKKPVKKVAKKALPKGTLAAQQTGSDPKELVSSFFSADNWGVVAVKQLGENGGVGLGALAGVGIWGLLVLRFVIFYGFFGDQ